MITGIDVDAMRADATQAQLLQSGADATFIVANLGDAGALDNVARQLAKRPPIDVLIHNAGINDVGPFAHADLDRQRAVLDVNLRAPLALTTDLLRQGRLREGGHACLSLIAFALCQLPRRICLRREQGRAGLVRAQPRQRALASDSLHVLTVFPGPTRTAHARRYSPDNSRENRRMAPDELARRIGDAVAKEQRVLIPGLGNRLFAAASRLAPRPRRANYAPHALRQAERGLMLPKKALAPIGNRSAGVSGAGPKVCYNTRQSFQALRGTVY